MSDPAELRRRALDLLSRGDTAGGIGDLKAYLEADPDDASAWLSLGIAYLSIAHPAEALAALKEAVELDGDAVDARLVYAQALGAAAKLDEAAFQLIQASKLDPADGRVLLELGIVFYDKRLFDKAAGFLERATTSKPDGIHARAFYALGLVQEARRDMGAAVAAYREAVRLDPRHAAAHATLADALASMGEHAAAISELDAVLALDRTNERIAHNREVLARALAELEKSRLLGKPAGELDKSAVVVEGGLKPKPGDATTVRFATPLLELLGRVDEGNNLTALSLVLTDPARAAQEDGAAFKVTVLSESGKKQEVDLATAATITFLREALGCPMTEASALYARLLKGEITDWGGASVAFEKVPRPDKPGQERPGLTVRRRE